MNASIETPDLLAKKEHCSSSWPCNSWPTPLVVIPYLFKTNHPDKIMPRSRYLDSPHLHLGPKYEERTESEKLASWPSEPNRRQYVQERSEPEYDDQVHASASGSSYRVSHLQESSLNVSFMDWIAVAYTSKDTVSNFLALVIEARLLSSLMQTQALSQRPVSVSVSNRYYPADWYRAWGHLKLVKIGGGKSSFTTVHSWIMSGLES